VVTVVGKVLAGFESWKTAHNSVTLDCGDPAILGTDDPLATLDSESPVAAVVDRYIIGEGVRLIRQSGKFRHIHHPVDRGLKSVEETRLHRKVE
jgi:hypothetical protein